MSELPGRNNPKNQPFEAESEIDKNDGRKEFVNLPEITREKRSSCLQ
jgi:hypothetical protein